jgi:glycosyltransferase involved in cell wall biosynthesis
MQAQPTISAVIAVHEEEQVIGRCLDSLQGVVDEIILVHDGPCGDRTVEIAEEKGAKVFVRERTAIPEGHTAFAYGQAKGDWLLNVDADEFLSDDLRAHLRELTQRPGVAGYRLLWPHWNGESYKPSTGPYKLVLFRRDAVSLIGVPHAIEHVEGRVERAPYQLEHKPLVPNYDPRTFLRKWRRWARVHAAAYLSPWETIDTYNVHARDWPLSRKLANALSPVLFIPYGIAIAVMSVRIFLDDHVPPLEAVRQGVYLGTYAALVQAYVAKQRYFTRA